MKITQVLWRLHLGRMTKRSWWRSGKKVILDTSAEKHVVSQGIQVVDAKDVVAEPKLVAERIEIHGLRPKVQPLDHTHPDWHEVPCLKYGNNSVLLEGADQAQVLIKAEYMHNALPDKLQAFEEKPSAKIEKLIKRFIYSSHMFDAHQEKLPKKKDPLRPAYNFARIYGLTDVRKTHNLTHKLLHLCELISDPMISQQRKMIHDGHVRTFIERDNDLLYFESTFDTMMMANKLLTPMSGKNDKFDVPLPNIYPLAPTISLQPDHIYNLQDHYPVAKESQWMNAHTIFVHYDSEKVKHITELPVTETQIIARSMIKSFATAACCAKLKFGEGVIDLPEPITIQCVHSNGQWFYFSVLQLNTLHISGDSGTRNIWWSTPRIELYQKAEYVDGIPTLEGYNSDVFKKILAFYRNV